MKKLVVKLEIYDEKAKRKAMKIVSGLSGVESIQVDLKDKKLTVVGDIDSVIVVSKLRKFYQAEIVSVGPAKEEKKDGAAKKEETKKPEEKAGAKDPVAELIKAYQYQAYNPYMNTHYYVRNAEENPNSCVIC